MIQRPLETDGVVRPVSLITVGEQEPAPAPLVRVRACGLLTLEIVQEIVSSDPPLACYRVLTPNLLQGRGIGPALTLLKLLVSRPQRFAPADWLREQFCQSEGEAFSSKRLDTLAWLLRDLLCPPGYAALRRQIVAHTRAMSGGGYQLAGYPLVWVDHEALCWNAEQAVRMERFGDDPLPFWQRAYELAKRGEYLPDEIYSQWAEARREEIAGLRRQGVLALARLYPEREGRAGEEQALVLLRSYWTEHPREEDILRPLLELLGRRDCYQEALEYYAKLCRVLEEDGQQPTQQTQDVAAYLRSKQIQRQKQVIPAPAEDRHDIMRLQQALVGPMKDLRRVVQQFFPQGSFVLPPEQAHLLFSMVQKQVMMGYFDPQKRKTLETLLEMLGIASGGFSLTDAQMWEHIDRLTAAFKKPSAIDMEVVKGLKNTSAIYWHIRLTGNVAPAELFSATEKQYHLILHLLQSPLLPSIRVALCSVAGEMALLGGMLLATDLSQFEKALSYYN